MRKAALFFIFMLSTAAGSAVAQDVYYVQSLKARIMFEPSFKSKVLGEASRGTTLLSSGREGNWVKVQFYKRPGYVSSLLVSKRPPLRKLGLIQGDEAEIRQSVRRRASTYTSAAAARGLAQDDRRRLSSDEKADYQGLERMEALIVSSEEVMRFMEGGKL